MTATQSARDVLLRIDELAEALMGAIAISGDRGAGYVSRSQVGAAVCYEVGGDDLVFSKDVVEQLIRAGWEFTPPAATPPERA